MQIDLTEEQAEIVSNSLIHVADTLEYLTACSGNGEKASKQARMLEKEFNKKYLKGNDMKIKEPTRTKLRELFNAETDFLIAEKEAVDRLRNDKDAGKRERIPFVANQFVARTGRITTVFLSVFDFEE